MGSGADADVTTIAVDNRGRILIGGYFGSFNGTRVGHLARVSSDGALDTTYAPFASGGISSSELWALEPLANGMCLVAGHNVGSRTQFILRLTTDGALDTSFSQGDLQIQRDSWIKAFGFQRDGGAIVGGGNASAASGFVVRLRPDGSVDPVFQRPTGLTWQVEALRILSDDSILLGFGMPQRITPMARPSGLVVLSRDGQVQTNFYSPRETLSIVQLSDGSILAGLKHFYPDGTLDTNFVCQCDNAVRSLAVQADGNVIIGGDFTTVNGLPRAGIARIHGPQGSSLPVLYDPHLSGKEFAIRIPTLPNRAYELQASDNFKGGAWTSVNVLTGDGNWQTISDGAPIGSRRFYRVRAE